MSIALIIYKSSAIAEMGDRLATIDMGRGLYLACVRKARKWGLLCPFPWGEGRAGSPSNTMWPGPRPTFVPISGILIHPAVWPQYTNVTTHTDIHGQPFYRRSQFLGAKIYTLTIVKV